MGPVERPWILRTERRVWVLCGLLMVLTLAFDLATPGGVASGVPYIAVILLSLWSRFRWFTPVLAFVCSMFTLVELGDHNQGFDPYYETLNRTIQAIAVWVTALVGISRRTVDQRWEEALSDRESVLRRLKILHGMLPICASCKKIRDDQGYWNMLETYIDEHSEAHFTHGICPECRSQLYPSLDEPASASSQPKEAPLVWHGASEDPPRARAVR